MIATDLSSSKAEMEKDVNELTIRIQHGDRQKISCEQKHTRQVSSKPIGAIRQAQFCHSGSRAMFLAASGTGPQVILMRLILRCTLPCQQSAC